ncbi:hypothetical protein F2Q68_00001098 [Brassica cretica]|uniref:Uncharacterized protein n=1 Tax=Brassica cretica TaxID=69181 RepID=A0A8S9JK05_BRACR|nr:hypothetical protein F2Q68_00001098 [Brassica cretica]
MVFTTQHDVCFSNYVSDYFRADILHLQSPPFSFVAYVSSPSSTSATASARPKNTSKSFSLSIRSASVSLSLYRRPHNYLILFSTYSLALQVYTTPAHHLDSTWSSPLTTTSASATMSAITSGQKSYIFNLPLLALCADQAQHSSSSATTLQPRSSPANFHTKCAFLSHEMCTTLCFSPP